MSDDGRVVGDPTEVLTRSGGSSYVSLTVQVPAVVPAPAPPVQQERTPSAPRTSRLRLVGWLALATAVLAAVVTGLGVGLASDGQFVTGTVLAWVAIVLSGAAVVGGILAVIAGWGRMPGVIAIPLALLANPFLLARLLDVASAATT